MAYEYDRFEREDGGGSFLMGLLAGTVLGAGLGMLFAPRSGSELRNQLSEQAGRLRSTAGGRRAILVRGGVPKGGEGMTRGLASLGLLLALVGCELESLTCGLSIPTLTPTP